MHFSHTKFRDRLVRLVLSVGLITAISWTWAGMAHADDPCYTFDGSGDSIYACYQSHTPAGSDEPPPPGRTGKSHAYVWYYFPAVTHIVDVNGVTIVCWATWRTTSSTYADDERLIFSTVHNLIGPPFRMVAQVDCPIQTIPPPPTPRHIANATDIQQAIDSQIRDTQQLPAPQLTVTPQNLVSGLPGYLSINSPATTSFDLLTEIGGHSVHIQLQSIFVVDWGDNSSEATNSHGGTFPNGDLTHTYRNAGSFTTTVTQRWDATWQSDDGTSGSLQGVLQTQATLPPIVVTQAEAVLRNS